MRPGKLFQRGLGRDRRPEPGDTDTTAAALSEADELARAGRLRDAIDRLVEANHAHRDPAVEIRTLRLREAAAEAIGPGPGRRPWPPVYADPFPDVHGALPEIEIDALTAEVLGGAVAHHGALIVRNLLRPDDARRIIDGIHRAEAQRERSGARRPGRREVRPGTTRTRSATGPGPGRWWSGAATSGWPTRPRTPRSSSTCSRRAA